MVRRASLALGWLLAVFHGWIFAVQAFNGEIAEPWLALRWAAAIAVIAGFVRLRRSGRSILRGRSAVALWLLVVLLHAPAVADRVNDPLPALPEVVTLLARESAAAGALASLLGLAALAAHRRERRAVPSGRPHSEPVFSAWLAPTQSALAPRPPPVA
jgi:hypothetical protein